MAVGKRQELLNQTQTQALLERIHYSGGRTADFCTLAKLQSAFLLSTPFENLDIHWGRPIRLGVDAAYRKIVDERRGGYCYELNGLFAALLETLGFRVALLSARMFKDGQPGMEFAHLVLRVDLEKAWLVDVGNGQSAREPLALDGSNETHAEGLSFRVQTINGKHYLMQWAAAESPQPRFIFDLTPRRIEEFSGANEFHQTSPESHFTKRPLSTIALPDGRATLAGDTFTLRQGDRIEERQIQQNERTEYLRKWFGIESWERKG
jgi:N-hydroxyarylamine O-acetyltransferase